MTLRKASRLVGLEQIKKGVGIGDEVGTVAGPDIGFEFYLRGKETTRGFEIEIDVIGILKMITLVAV